jgi:hypothetical protein
MNFNSIKEKIEFINHLKSNKIDLSRTEDYISLSSHSFLKRPILLKLVEEMVRLDTQISVHHDMVTEEEWDAITTLYSTPTEDDHCKTISDKMQVFTHSFSILCANLSLYSASHMFLLFDEYVLSSKTRNVQFLMFQMCLKSPDSTLAHLLSKIVRQSPLSNHYIPFLCSLLVRCKIGGDIFNMCVSKLQLFAKSRELRRDLSSILLAQSLLYISCFRKETLEGIREYIDRVFKEGYVRYMNKRVVEVFCKLCGYTCVGAFKPMDNDLLYFFPFDPPVIPQIKNLFMENYLVFGNK